MTSSVSRRTLVSGTAWAVPAVAVAAAAPSFAASPTVPGCNEPISWWDVGADQSTGALPNPVVYWAGDVRVTVTNTGAVNQPSNFIANDGSGQRAAPDSAGAYPGSLALKSETSGPNEQTMAPQFVTFRFSRPVTDLTFSVRDIDRDHDPRYGAGAAKNPGFMDQVFIADGSPRPSNVVRGAHLEGEGTEASPWNTKPISSLYRNQPSNPNFDVTLTWSGEVTEVTVGYKQGVRQKNSFPTVWISPLRFRGPSCP